MNHRPYLIAAAAGSLAIPASAAVLFSVRNGGPSNLAGDQFFISPGLNPAGLPISAGGGSGSGLGMLGDEVDGSSRRGQYTGFVLCFGVDDDSVGDQPPVGVDGGFPPFFVADQAIKNQHPADAYITTEAFDPQLGKLPPPTSIGDDFHVLARNQSQPYIADFGLLPNAGPNQFVPNFTPLDDVDGETCIDDPNNIGDVFFSLSSNSPSINGLPGAPSGANVYLDPDITVGGNEQIFATAASLSLDPADDIDALVVQDAMPGGQFDKSSDFIAFSLTPGSPTLKRGNLSAADVLIVDSMGLRVLAFHFEIGLLQSDNLDSLAFVPLLNGSAQSTLDAVFDGQPPACPDDVVMSIPVSTPWGLLILSIGVVGVGLWMIRKGPLGVA